MANNSMLLTPNSTTTTTKTTNEMIGKKRKTELPILNTYWINTGKQLFASKFVIIIFSFENEENIHTNCLFCFVLFCFFK